MENQFAVDLVSLQIPDGMSSSISVGGFPVEADADGIVQVPTQFAALLRDHGLTDPKPKPASKKGA